MVELPMLTRRFKVRILIEEPNETHFEILYISG